MNALAAEGRVLGLVECANVKQIVKSNCRTVQTLAGAADTGAGGAGHAVLTPGAGEGAGDFFSSFSLSFFLNMACVCAAGEGRRERRSPPSFHNKPLCDIMDWIIGDLRGHLRSNQGQLLSGELLACVDECCCSAGLLNVLQELEFVNRNKSEGKARPTNRISAF